MTAQEAAAGRKAGAKGGGRNGDGGAAGPRRRDGSGPTPRSARSRGPSSPTPSRAHRAVWPIVVSVTVIGVLFLFVFPGRTYLAQHRSLVAAQARLHVLQTQNKALDERVARLHDDAEIERLAREQYGLVKPGEEAYAILPSPTPPAPPAPAKKEAPSRNWAERLWHAVF